MIQLQNTEMNFIMVVDILSSIYIYIIFMYIHIYMMSDYIVLHNFILVSFHSLFYSYTT